MNTIIGGITKALQPLLGGVGKILGGFNPFSFLTSAVDAFQNVVSALDCNEPPADYALASNEWTIGVGTNEGSGTPVSQILETANKAREAASRGFGIVDAVQDIAGLTGSLGVFDFANPSVSTPGFESVLGNCYAGPPELGGCGGTKIKIFGGKGIGGVANAIIGLANADRGVTGSLLGVDLVNGGGGYTTPPFVEIIDECKSGYGAVARAVIDYNPNSPTYQQITDIILVSGGEGYTPSVDNPVNDITINTENPATVVTPGVGYTPDTSGGTPGTPGGDTVIDNIGNVYDIEVDENGGIIKLIVRGELKFPQITGEVEFEINSQTGFGAILKPRFKRRPIEPQGEVKQVIDCISKDDDLVGYVNGKAYYGPFHIHPTNGRKMVGATHTSAPHQYIYDTQAESLGSSSGTVSTTTQIIRETSSTSSSTSSSTTTTSTTSSTTTPPPSSTPPPTTSGGGGSTPSTSTPTPSPTPTPPSPPTPPPSSGGGGYGGGY